MGLIRGKAQELIWIIPNGYSVLPFKRGPVIFSNSRVGPNMNRGWDLHKWLTNERAFRQRTRCSPLSKIQLNLIDGHNMKLGSGTPMPDTHHFQLFLPQYKLA